jgi:hypothetical protein
MKTTKRLLITSALLLLGAYSIYTTVRIQQLETRLHREQIGRSSTSQVTYAFDNSFRDYFGEKGVAEVERALEILRNPEMERAPQIEDIGSNYVWQPPIQYRPKDRPRLDGK